VSKLKSYLLSGVVLAGCSVSLSALPLDLAKAQDKTDASAPEEVVVTAQKRAQRLQDVPLAVSAFSDQQIADSAAQNLTDFSSKVPNVILAPVGAFPYAGGFFIRGLGFADVESTYEPAVGTEVNGVYYARNSGATSDFFDLGSIEVLRGPQGTLYGLNTIGGVVSLTTKRPTGDFDGELMVTGGDHDRFETRGAVDFPITDDLAGRFSFLTKDYDGDWKNDFNDRSLGAIRSYSGRATFVWNPVSNFDATLILDGDSDRDQTPGTTNESLPGMLLPLFGFPASTLPKLQVDQSGPFFMNFNNYGGSLEANWHLSFGTVTSVTGLRTFTENTMTNFGGVPFDFLDAQRVQTQHQVSEELRLASDPGGSVDYVFGLFFLNQHYHLTNYEGGAVFGGGTYPLNAGQGNNDYAGFGQVDWHATDKLTVTAGGRYSVVTKDFTLQPLLFTTSQSYNHDWYNFSPKLGVSYAWTPDFMTYVQWTKGFRSGGYDGRAASFTTAGPYRSEDVSSYEAGFKSQWLDHRLTINGDVFLASYSQMQIQVQESIGGINQTVTTNAASSQESGVEMEGHYTVLDGLTIDGDLGYLSAAFDKGKFIADLVGNGVLTDNSGLPFAYAPKWTGSIGPTYTTDIGYGTITANTSLDYAAKQYTSFSIYNASSNFALRSPTALLNATLTWTDPDDRWTLSAWAKNLTNDVYPNDTYNVGSLLVSRIYAPGRTWGVNVGVKF
jgi:iron complex outermembrane recepter protein